MSSLALPDICAWLETPSEHSSTRYKRWIKKWLEKNYRIVNPLTGEEHAFMTAGDLYALRCAILHSGADDVTPHKSRELLDAFILTSINGNFCHLNSIDNELQLDTETFCREICNAVTAWDKSVRNDPEIQARKGSLVRIRNNFDF